MNTMTTLEQRALSRICTPEGRLLIVAADQRNGMKAVMPDPTVGSTPATISTAQLAEAKADIVTHLGNHAPAILLDPEVALPEVVADGTLSPHTGLVVGMDASGFETRAGLRYTRFVDGVSPRTVRDLGGDAAKMLFYVRPDQQGVGSDVHKDISDLVDACNAEGVLLIVELLTYRLDDEDEQTYQERFPQLVVEAARLGATAGAKILKMAYPGSREASAEVTAAADGTPWAVLSAGVDHDTFAGQVTEAVIGGASGAMAGRALWKDSLSTSSAVRESLLTTRALPRLRQLQDILSRAATATAQPLVPASA
jgi:sulfofructosephosphate aldolase